MVAYHVIEGIFTFRNFQFTLNTQNLIKYLYESHKSLGSVGTYLIIMEKRRVHPRTQVVVRKDLNKVNL